MAIKSFCRSICLQRFDFKNYSNTKFDINIGGLLAQYEIKQMRNKKTVWPFPANVISVTHITLLRHAQTIFNSWFCLVALLPQAYKQQQMYSGK